MKNKIAQLLALLLTLVMLVNSLPISAHAVTYSGTCGENLTWSLENDILTISGFGPMADYEREYAPWRDYYFHTLVLNDGITHIGEGAFRECVYITSASIPDSITSIGDWAFSGCKKLDATRLGTTNVISDFTIPDGVVTIGVGAFIGCDSLRRIIIPDSVTSLGIHAFCDCEKLSQVVIPSSVGEISCMFMNCYNLTDVTIHEGISSIGHGAFENCYKLTSISIPASVSSIEFWVFRRCSNLSEITFFGDAPQISADAFTSVEAIAYYPINKYWPESARQNYGGNLTWVPYGEPTSINPPITEPPVTEPPVMEPTVPEPPVVEPTIPEPPVVEPTIPEPPVVEPTAPEPPAILPSITGTYTTDFTFSATDLGVNAPDATLRATLTFTEDGQVSATWEAIDLTAMRTYFHQMFVNSYYALAYGMGITDIDEIEQFCMDSTGMSVSDYMEQFVPMKAIAAAFTPAPTSGTYSYNDDHSAIYTDLTIMGSPSDPSVADSFVLGDDTLYLNAASWGKPDYTFVCTRR